MTFVPLTTTRRNVDPVFLTDSHNTACAQDRRSIAVLHLDRGLGRRDTRRLGGSRLASFARHLLGGPASRVQHVLGESNWFCVGPAALKLPLIQQRSSEGCLEVTRVWTGSLQAPHNLRIGRLACYSRSEERDHTSVIVHFGPCFSLTSST